MAFYTFQQDSSSCKCCLFIKGLDLPIPRYMTRADAEHHAGELKASIQADWETLQKFVSRFEKRIQTRWHKKCVGQRRILLENGWKDMSKTHRPDFVSLRDRGKAAQRSTTDSYLWPYVNLEDLQRPMPLLWFIHARAWKSPNDCVLNDVQEAHLGRGWAFSSATAWTQGEASDEEPATLDLLVLEIQQRIYAFLVSIVRSILYDITPKDMEQQPVQDPLQPRNESVELTNYTVRRLFMQYSMFGKPSVDLLLIHIDTRKELAVDHLRLLREHPGYFKASMQERKEHSGSENCDEVALEMIYTAIYDVLCWDRVLNSMSVISNTDSIPKDSLITIMDALRSMRGRLESNFSLDVPRSPRLRRYYDCSHPKPSLNPNPPKAVSRFYNLFALLQDKLHNYHHVIDEIQYALDTAPALSELLTPWAFQKFSDLAMLAEIELSIETLDHRLHKELKEGAEEQILYLPIFDQLTQTCEGFTNQILTDAGLKDFKYPAPNQRNKAKTDQRRAAEQALDGFWSTIEKHAEGSSCKELLAFLEQHLPQELHRTPKWAPILLQSKPNLAPNDAAMPAASVVDDHIGEAFVPVRHKDKVKTRGIPAVSDVLAELPMDEDDNRQKVTVPVQRAVYELLSAMLPSSKEEHCNKQFPWTELVKAMGKLGFEHGVLHGSARIFRPMEGCLLAHRSIQFHQPEEVRKGGKISPGWLRVFGRRLTRAFQWEAGLFVPSDA